MSSSGRKVAQIRPVFATVRLAWSDQSYKKTIFLTCTSIFWNCSYSLLSAGMYFGVWFMVGRAVLVWLSLLCLETLCLFDNWNGWCWWIVLVIYFYTYLSTIYVGPIFLQNGLPTSPKTRYQVIWGSSTTESQGASSSGWCSGGCLFTLALQSNFVFIWSHNLRDDDDDAASPYDLQKDVIFFSF